MDLKTSEGGFEKQGARVVIPERGHPTCALMRLTVTLPIQTDEPRRNSQTEYPRSSSYSPRPAWFCAFLMCWLSFAPPGPGADLVADESLGLRVARGFR